MPILVTCPKCGRKYRLRDSQRGRQFHCADCETVVDVPADDPIIAPPTRSAAKRGERKNRPRKTRRRRTGKRSAVDSPLSSDPSDIPPLSLPPRSKSRNRKSTKQPRDVSDDVVEPNAIAELIITLLMWGIIYAGVWLFGMTDVIYFKMQTNAAKLHSIGVILLLIGVLWSIIQVMSVTDTIYIPHIITVFPFLGAIIENLDHCWPSALTILLGAVAVGASFAVA